MSDHVHRAIVVTGDRNRLEEIHALAVEMFRDTPCHVTEMTPVAVNGYSSFFVAPDGSGITYPTHREANTVRTKFLSDERLWTVDAHEVVYGETPQAYVVTPYDDDEY